MARGVKCPLNKPCWLCMYRDILYVTDGGEEKMATEVSGSGEVEDMVEDGGEGVLDDEEEGGGEGGGVGEEEEMVRGEERRREGKGGKRKAEKRVAMRKTKRVKTGSNNEDSHEEGEGEEEEEKGAKDVGMVGDEGSNTRDGEDVSAEEKSRQELDRILGRGIATDLFHVSFILCMSIAPDLTWIRHLQHRC